MSVQGGRIPGQEYPDENPEAIKPSIDLSLEEAETPETDNQWIALSSSIYETGQDYYEQSLQRSWQRNARHWNNKHATDSKFNSEAYKQRSRLFRPLTRTTERNSSASLAAALFGNTDIISTVPTNPNLPMSAAAAAVMKELLQYRLEHDVKWYLTVLGAWQDSFIYGPCISYVYWEYEERFNKAEPVEQTLNDAMLEGEVLDLDVLDLSDLDLDSEGSGSPDNEFNYDTGLDGEPETFGGQDEIPVQTDYIEEDGEVVKDGLAIDLVPVEYFRADPACDWRDVVNSSPYIIRIVPMYVTDIEQKMVQGEWKKLDRAQILSTGDKNLEYDAVRRAREGDERADSIDDTTRTEDTDFEVLFAHENYVRLEGREWVYWTLGTQALLTEPKPLEEVYWHGRRPMVYGFSVIEAHKYAPNGNAENIRPLQENINDLTNQRIDNIKLALNKRYIVKRGAQVDLAALARNVPGGSVVTDNPEQDVSVVNTPDITTSVFAETDRITNEANEVAGTFSGSSVQSNRALNETVGGMQLLSEGANQLQEFDIRTFVETFVGPTLELAALNIQKYENDEQIIAIAGEKALESFPDVDGIAPEDVWNTPVQVKVNVGLGATSPMQRINNLNLGLNAVMPFVDPQRVNTDEIVKEVMGGLGYSDGDRFIITEEQLKKKMEVQPPATPPEVQKEQLKIQGQMEIKQMEIASRERIAQMEIEANMQINMARIAADGDKTLKGLEKDMRLGSMNDKTKRDTVAAQEGTKNREMALKRETGEGI